MATAKLVKGNDRAKAARSSILEEAVEHAVLDGMESFVLPLYRSLVEQPSCSREPEDVEAAQQIYSVALRSLGFSDTRHSDKSGEYADHRVFESPKAAAEPALKTPLLVGHMDTVFPRSLGFSGFRREGDQVFGPGVLDMKGGLAVIAGALHGLRALDPSLFSKLPLRLVVVSDEEVGSPHSRALFSQLAPLSTVGLVFEAGRASDRIVTRRKGGGFFQLTAHGKAAHAGNHHQDGVNAITALSHAAISAAALTDYERGVTVNVGLVEGGTAKNTVPDLARCDVDVRFEAADHASFFQPELEKAARAAEQRVPGARIEVTGGITRLPLESSPASQSLRAQYEAAALDSGLSVGEAPLQGGGSDANLLSAAGVPSIDGLGPFGEHFHRVTEWASISSLERRISALIRWLARHGASLDG